MSSRWPSRRAGARARPASVFDVIGKRRWFYAFSLLITIPGLIFIILTFLTGGQEGLKFSIDFTGGTVLEVHFARDQQPTPAEIRAVLDEQGLDGDSAVVTTGDKQYVLIRTEALGLVEQPPPTAPPLPSASGSPGASATVVASASPSPSASSSPSPSSSAAAGAGGSPSPSGSPGA